MIKNPPAMQETWVRSLGWEDFLGEGNGSLTAVFLLGKFHRQRSLVGYSPWGLKESDMTESLIVSLFFFIYMHNNYFAAVVHLKLTKCCKSTTFQFNKKTKLAQS